MQVFGLLNWRRKQLRSICRQMKFPTTGRMEDVPDKDRMESPRCVPDIDRMELKRHGRNDSHLTHSWPGGEKT